MRISVEHSQGNNVQIELDNVLKKFFFFLTQVIELGDTLQILK